jgi:hypothetical protein
LGLWRGSPLADFTFDAFAANEIVRLEELRLEALEVRIDADLALGRHAALVAELEALATEHPLRERLRAQRMVALYRCGREPEALALYRETRKALVDELGMEPSPALRELAERCSTHAGSRGPKRRSGSQLRWCALANIGRSAPFIDLYLPLVVPLREGDLCVSRQRGYCVRRLLAMGDPRLCRRVRPGHDGAPERVSRLADRAEAGGAVACLPA